MRIPGKSIVEYIIRTVTTENLPEAVDVIRRSFATVAEEFGLTEENCPNNGAFITEDRLKTDLDRGSSLSGLFLDDSLVGFVAHKRKEPSTTWYIEKLAVLPEFRHRGFGKALLEYVVSQIRRSGGERISIGVIADNIPLVRWYARSGFVTTGTRQFASLPFLTRYMELTL